MSKNCLDRHIWAKTRTQNIDVVIMKSPKKLNLNPGCGGIRGLVTEFQETGYIEVFLSAILLRKRNVLQQSTWVIGGDGRYYFKEALKRTLAIMAGYKVGNVVIPKDGIITTAAMCHVVQKMNALGGILLMAGHLPAGPAGYTGIKYVCEGGGTVSDARLKVICDIALSLESYKHASGIEFPLDEITSYNFGVEDKIVSFTVMSAVRMYADYMKSIFDYERIRNLLTGDDIVSIPVRIVVDCMNGAGGPYATEVLEYDLGAAEGSVINTVPMEEYTVVNPSPMNSKALLQRLKMNVNEIGFGLDIDAGKVMVMGKGGYHVYGGDSAAVLAAHLHCIPYFQINGIKGFARSLQTSKQIDKVAESEKKPLYEVPRRWIYFCDLIKKRKISFCGDSNYALGSSHLLESDGIWGILAWLSVMHHMRLSVKCILHNHWIRYGRYFTARMAYENIDEKTFFELVDFMEFILTHEMLPASQHGRKPFVFTIQSAQNYKYTHANTTRSHGIVINFLPQSRIIYRMGYKKVTRMQIYLESYSTDPADFEAEPVAFLFPLAKLALQMANISHFLEDITPTYML